ncbi:MAG: phosphoribosylaminoimidazolesuccinocarboxamide synthase, partial [Thermodesulfovibrio sp.]
IIIDELLTPDSSRFWSIKDYSPGKPQDSYDKQIVRDYLISINWNKKPPAPELPEEIVKKTAERYEEIFRILTS